MAAALSGYVPVKVDVDQNPQLALKYGADQFLPSFIVLDANGNTIKSADHAFETPEFLAWLKGGS